jgi:hypothetical protein
MKQQQKHCLAKTEKKQPTSNENNTSAPKKSQQVTMKTTQHLHFFFTMFCLNNLNNQSTR